MEYRIRKLRVSEIRLLRTFLYEAIYQPSSKGKLPVNVIDTPELYLYIKDWGKTSDYCLVLEIENIIVGAIWVRILKNGYGYINDTIPEICMSLLKDFRNQGFGSLLIKKMLHDMSIYR